MNESIQKKSKKTPISVSVAALATNFDKANGSTPMAQVELTSSRPVVLIWDPSESLPQLVKIETVCSILSIEKSAAHALVAAGELRPPLKFGTSRRAAARWLLSDVVHFVQTLADKR